VRKITTKIYLFRKKEERKYQPEQCNFIRKLAIYTHKMGVHNPKLNCSTAAKHPTTFPDSGEIFAIFCQFRVKNHEKHPFFAKRRDKKPTQTGHFYMKIGCFLPPNGCF